MSFKRGKVAKHVIDAAIAALERGDPLPQTYELARAAKTSKQSICSAIFRLRRSGRLYLGADRKILEVRI